MSNEISNLYGQAFSTFCYANACAFPATKLIQAGCCKASGIAAKVLNIPSIGEWNQETNHYLALAKKNMVSDLTAAVFLAAIGYVSKNGFDDLSNMSKALYIASCWMIANRICPLVAYKTDSVMARLLGKENVLEWDKTSNECLAETKKDAIHQLAICIPLILTGLAFDGSIANPLQVLRNISILYGVTSGVIVGNRFGQAAAYKIGGAVAEILGKQNIAEWNKTSDDYLTVGIEEVPQNLEIAKGYAGMAIILEGARHLIKLDEWIKSH